MRRFRLSCLILAASAAGCSSPNIKSAKDYSRQEAPFVRNPRYNPYAAYGSANATWVAPVYNRDGTITKPAEPSSQHDRQDYEGAAWATGADGGGRYTPAGTF